MPKAILPLVPLSSTQVAEICHEALRAYCVVADISDNPDWGSLPRDRKDRLIEAVEYVFATGGDQTKTDPGYRLVVAICSVFRPRGEA